MHKIRLTKRYIEHNNEVIRIQQTVDQKQFTLIRFDQLLEEPNLLQEKLGFVSGSTSNSVESKLKRTVKPHIVDRLLAFFFKAELRKIQVAFEHA